MPGTTRPVSYAVTTACVRSRSPSFVSIRLTWDLTVSSATWSRPEISAFDSPRPTAAAQVGPWLQKLATCVENRIEGTSYDAQGNPQNSEAVSGLENYRGVAVSGFNGDVVVVRWSGAVPQIVLDRVGNLPAGTHVAYVTTAQ